MLRYGSIYTITNTTTGDQYVGQTRQLALRRWRSHINTANSSAAPKYKIAKAINEYGPEAFIFEEIFSAFSPTALNDVEIEFIAALAPKYNTTKGGAGHRGVTPSKELCQARADGLKQRWADPVWREKQRAKLKAAAQTPEAKARGENLARLRQAQLLGREPKVKPPQKNLSEILRRSWEVPEIRAARIAGLKRAAQTPEARKRRSDFMRSLVLPKHTLERIARARWKPVYCPELQCSFLSHKAASEFLGVLRTSVTNAIKQKGRVAGKYTLEKVA